HAPGRLEAIRKMRVALEEMTVDGIETNINFLYLILFHNDFLVGNVDTAFLEKNTDAIIRWGEESKKA
ncbi:MAG: acetyl-CoA carboxylase biotin carboxylase subunit, partial [Lachnospiraceae bacterium]|nr:acetyl-CoA carboxylase biotin carboxylase subunit [Lachnospiraceae bacterium]